MEGDIQELTEALHDLERSYENDNLDISVAMIRMSEDMGSMRDMVQYRFERQDNQEQLMRERAAAQEQSMHERI
jgi:hypothetical protein